MSELDVAMAVAREAGERLMAALHAPHEIRTKSTAIDWVTEMDREVERFIIGRLREAFPSYGILSEESPEQSGHHARWIVDPLDGTVNYAHGYPHFAVSIALEREGHIVVGVVYDPVLDELFAAERGRGAWVNGRPLQVARTVHLERALLASGSPYDVHTRPEPYMRLWRALVTHALAVRQSGAAALDLCYVAAGRLDGYVEWQLEPWDVAAGSLIVQEAGGRVSDAHGGPDFIYGRSIVAASPALWSHLMALLRPTEPPTPTVDM